MATTSKLPAKWAKEQKAAKAIQVAFDVGNDVQTKIKKEALDQNVSASDRVRQILGLEVTSKPKRPRLSISLSPQDFVVLAEKYQMNPDDNVGIKQKAAESLIDYIKCNK